MGLQAKIREDMVAAMKSKDTEKVSFLRVIAGEFGRKMNNGIELEDKEVIAILKSMKKDSTLMGNDYEIQILDQYIPAMLGEKQIEVLVSGIINKNGYTQPQEMGKVMQEIKTLPTASQIDGKVASQIARNLLTQ